MKILLDECVTKKLRQFLNTHSIFTVSQMKWNGLRNGMLLSKSVQEGFDMVITIDKNLQYQQRTEQHNIIIVVFDLPTSNINDVKQFIPKFELQIGTYEKEKTYVIT